MWVQPTNAPEDELDALRMDVSGGAVDRLVFPNPEKIAGATASNPNPVVLKLQEVSFRHAGADHPVINGVSAELTASSKVGIIGKNGSGKSTLLSLLASRLQPNVSGELWQHGSARLVYIQQHSEEQLADYMDCTAVEYLQLRFRRGYDAEAPHRTPPSVGPKQQRRIKELAERHGKHGKEVEELLTRHYDHESKECFYEVKWKGLSPAENTFEKRVRLQKLGVGHLVEDFDEMLSAAWGNEPQRPLTVRELAKHFSDFGLPEDAASHRKISMLSSGQRVKLLLATSFWTRPHLVFFDEPTNYLDMETVESLQKALCHFRGGFVVVSHNEQFIEGVCDEIWEMADGQVSVKVTNSKKAILKSDKPSAGDPLPSTSANTAKTPAKKKSTSK
jgi:elongation factor 3